MGVKVSKNDETLPEGSLCLVDGLYGVHVPQRFATNYGKEAWHVSEDDTRVLLEGPDNVDYNETWDDVVRTAYFEQNGKVYNLYQDGDLWAVPKEQ